MAKRKTENINPNNKKKRPFWKRCIKFTVRAILILLLLVFLLLLFIRSPWGQDIIVGKVTNYISKKTHTEVSIEKLFITFSGKVDLQKLYLEDQKGDTLLYSRELEAAIPIWPIIKGEPISINRVNWKGLKANVYRKDSLSGFNYQFLIDAFDSDEPKDTTDSEMPKISLGNINFSDFDLRYNDEVTGMKAALKLGNFQFIGNKIDLKTMDFKVKKIAIANTQISYQQLKALKPEKSNAEISRNETSDEAEPSPKFAVDKLELNKVYMTYNAVSDSLYADLKLDHFLLTSPQINLDDQVISASNIDLSNSSINFINLADNQNNNKNDNEEKEASEESFEWPDWTVDVKQIAFENDNFHIQNGDLKKEGNSFDPNNIELSGFNLNVNEIHLSKAEKLSLNLTELSFDEVGGINLNQLSFNLAMNAQQIQLDKFNFSALNTSLSGDFNVDYPSINQFIDAPDKSSFEVNLNTVLVDMNDVFRFLPDLKNNEYLYKLSQRQINGKLLAKGNLDQLDLADLRIHWGAQTQLNARGTFADLTDPDQLKFALNRLDFKTYKKDIVHFVDEKDLGISVPKTLYLSGTASGELKDLKTDLTLQIPEGAVKLNAAYAQKGKQQFKADLIVQDFDLGKLLDNPDVGHVAFTLKTSGEGDSLDNLNAELTSNFDKLEYNQYDFSDLDLSGNINQGMGSVDIGYNDSNLDLAIHSKLDLDSVRQKIGLDVKLNGADLYALGFSDKKMRAGLESHSDILLKDDNIDVKTNLNKGTVVYEKRTYHLGDVDLAALLHKDSTSVDVGSDFLNGKLRSNAGIDSISIAMGRQIKRYFYDSIAPQKNHKPVQLKFDMDFIPNDLITEVFVPSIKSMDTLKLNVDFKEDKNLLKAKMAVPYIDYAGNVIDDLSFKLYATENAGYFKFGFDQLDAGAFVMNPTHLNGDLKNSQLTLNFNSVDDEGNTYYGSQTILTGKNDVLTIHVNPESLITQGEEWHIPEDNKIEIDKKSITASNFVLTRHHQEVKIDNNLIPINKNNIGIGFKNFKLSNLLALLNPNDYIAEGQLQGKIVAVDPMGKLGLLANFKIEDLEALNVPLGDLSLKGISKEENHYRFKLNLKGDDVNIETKGDYAATEDEYFKMGLDINRIGFKTISELSKGQINEGEGFLSGRVVLNKEEGHLNYEGYFKFINAAFKVNELNTKFYLKDEKLAIDNEGLKVNHFTIEDEAHNPLHLDGMIFTKNMLDPTLDLSINAEGFQPVNSTDKDNKDFYGTLNLDLKGTVKGKMSFPKVDLEVNINKNTDFVYVLSESRAAIEKRDGIVEFVNKDNPEDILTRQKEDSLNRAKVTGIQLHSRIKIDKEAKLGAIIDPRTGDKLEVSGDANLDFRIARNGKMNLSGRYTINDGYYKMSLYHLVKRQFDFKRGGTITWNGDPLDADLNVTALYKMKTSASGLMSSQLAGASQEEQNKYRQVLPFIVDLNVNGSIDYPELSFGLDMPEDSKGALGGAVYERVSQLNEEDEGELNKQVFSLLVLNRFYPQSGSDGSEGGVANLARNNLNKALSDQLNTFSDKLMGDTGVQLNFGLDSYTDYQGESADQRTDLNVSAQKKLFNDRLVVKAGTDINVQGDRRPGEENPLVGNVSIEYLLTKDGRWRMQGFRKTEYENIIDGQVFVNGIGLVFQRQFNHFRELYKSFFNHPEKTLKEKEEDKKRKKTEKQKQKEEGKNKKKQKEN